MISFLKKDIKKCLRKKKYLVGVVDGIVVLMPLLPPQKHY
jgi:hypothetical protein